MKSILLGAAIGAAALIVSIGSAQADSVTITTGDASRHGDRIDHRDDGEWDHHWRHHRSSCVIKVTRSWHHGTMVVKKTQICHPGMAGDYESRPSRY